MRIGFVQFCPTLNDVDANIHQVDRLSARFKSADLVVLPELSNSGYNFESAEQARRTAEDTLSGPFVTYLLSLASRQDQFIVAGINERDPQSGDLYNSAVLCAPEGVIGKYRKLHLFMNEKDFFKPGNLGLPLFDLGGCTVGILICFDWIFPETWRVLTLRGADIVCHPANLVIPGLAQRAVPVQAAINRIFVITANRIGRERDLSFTGRSTIADPRGEVLAQASPDKPEVTIVDVDTTRAKDKNITPRNNVLTDRRPEEYTHLVSPNE
ncbi:MAG: nitrilase-related carbon-nitrogen hydrolase [Phycisphaerae bacterium]|jgi:predicted amidohydrolase